MPDLDRLLAAIDAEEADAYGSDSDSQLAAERAYAINLYLGKNVDPVMEGRSSVIDRSVFETVEWIKPSLCRIFANGDGVVELPPIGPDDVESAKQEGEYLNHVVTQKNNWFEIFLNWCTDALLTKNAYAKAYRDVSVETSVERYERQTEAGLAALLSDKDVEVTGQRAYPDPDYQPQPVADPLTGQPAIGPDGMPMMQPSPMLYDVELRRRSEKGKICIKVLAPERCKISERTPSWRLADCDYFEHWDFKTVSQLRSEGFDVPDDINGGEDPETLEDGARDQYAESKDGETRQDPSMRRVKVRSIWIRHDYDQDGIAELLYVVRVGREILYQEEVSRIPVACIVPNPLPHRHVGLSIADITADIQRIKTAILRQGLDNLYLSNNTRHAITSKVNLDDMLMNRPGGVVQIEDGGIPANEIMPLVTPFVFPQAMEGLEYMDQVRENRTGTNRYFTGIDQNAMNKTATGIQQLSSMAAQRVEQIARIIATGVEDLFSIVHELILKAGHQKEVVQLRGQWVEVDPATWKKRGDFKIAVGYAAGNKDALVQKLMMIMNFQKEAMIGGLPIVQPQNIYESGMELIKACDMTSPGRFLTEPSKAPPPSPPQPDATVMAAEQLKSQTTLQAKQLDVEQKERDSQRDFEIKKYELMLQPQLKQMEAETAVHLKDKEAETQAGLKRLDGEQAAGLESMRAEIKAKPAMEVADQVKEMANALHTALTSMQEALNVVLTAKRQIRRGKDGRAEGVDVVGPDGSVLASQKVERGPDGRVVGTV